jgi:hypothetical protein
MGAPMATKLSPARPKIAPGQGPEVERLAETYRLSQLTTSTLRCARQAWTGGL